MSLTIILESSAAFWTRVADGSAVNANGTNAARTLADPRVALIPFVPFQKFE